MKIAIVGSGYVGLVAGACFAESGNNITCVDVDEKKIANLKDGIVPIFEPGLSEMITSNYKAGRIDFTTDIKLAVENSDVIFIAVGTPQDHDGSADLKYVLEVASSIGKHLNGYKVIVDKSTVPVGTADKVRAEISKHTDLDFDVVSNPEFLKEGAAIDDFMKPDRVVIGADNEKSAGIMEEVYAPFVRTNNPILVMGIRSAEMTKYAANAMLATKISFMNEVANLCDAVGADVNDVRIGIGSDSRIGPSFLFAGAGYGGSCFPKDTRALVNTAKEHGVDFKIVKAVDQVNERQKMVLVDKIEKHFGSKKAIKGKKFAIWGLSFKPRTDDMREAPSLTIISALTEMGASVVAYDPEAIEEAKHAIGDNSSVEFAKDNYSALSGADALIIITEWNEFRRPDFDKMKEELGEAIVFDGRNLYEPAKMEERGFVYHSIGRPIASLKH